MFIFQAITQPQNITISVQVKDDGVIVGRGYQYILSTPLSAVFNCTIVVSGMDNQGAVHTVTSGLEFFS